MKKRIGIIGIGSMGKMLLNGFIKSKVISQNQINITTYTKEKLNRLKIEFPDINIFEKASDVTKNSDLIFICVKPMEVKQILNEIIGNLTINSHLISIAGCVTINNIEKMFNGKISKVIPSLTSEVLEGISLICHNEKVKEEDKIYLENILNKLSTVKNIKENDFEIAADLTSCAPGLIAAIFNEYVNAALPFSNFSREEATDMVIKTLYGTAKLMKDKEMSFEETLTRVATKGGITEEGAKVLNEQLPNIFKTVFEKTLNKHEIVKSTIKNLF